MPEPPVAKNYAIPSIQTVYNLNVGREYKEGVPTLHCKNVIMIPIAEPVARQFGNDTYTVTPFTELVIENGTEVVLDDVKIVIETNEGVTVEPIVVHAPLVQYNTAYLLTLPRGTTGIKKAYIKALDEYGFVIQNDIVFDIMEAPYNYENYLIALNYYEFVNFKDTTFNLLRELQQNVYDMGVDIANLKARVTALENKAGT